MSFEAVLILILVLLFKSEFVPSTPPPLPPRKRSNTNQESEFRRSYTNPETDTFKKRNIFDFLRNHKRTGSNSSRADANTPGGSSKEGTPPFQLMCHARNSFSSPDLMKPPKDGSTSSSSDECNDLDMVDGNFSILSNSSFLDSGSIEAAEISENSVDESVSPTPLISTPIEFPQCSDDMNISENILSTYNISCNMSTINLVGANVVAFKTAQLEDHSSGYCRMVPIFSDVAAEDEQPVQIPLIHAKTPTGDTEDMSKAITFERGDNVVDGLRMLSICTTPENRHSGSSTENIEPPQQHPAATPTDVIYANVTTKDTPLMPHNSQSTRKRLKAKNLFLCARSSSNQSSNDEKYPSYYPNTSPTTPDAPTLVTTKKSPKALLVRSHHHQTPRTENVYIATPHTKSSRKSPPAHKSSSAKKVQIKSRYRGSPNTPPTSTNKSVTPNASAIRNISIQIEPDPNNRHINSSSIIVMNEPGSGDGGDADDNVAGQTPNRLYRKYATHARISPARLAASNSTDNVVTPIIDGVDTGSTGLAASLKRFRSLPRFRGIDFSPLKLRINNVLQRYNSDNSDNI